MSRLRTSSPWTTPTTPLGARILSEEPVTVDAIPTMSLGEMEAVLGRAVTPPGRERRRAPRSGSRAGAPLRQVAAVAAVLVALVGGAGGVAAGAGRPSRPAPTSAASPSAVELVSEPGVGAAWGAAMAVGAPAPGSATPLDEAVEASGGVAVLPVSVERVPATVAQPGQPGQPGQPAGAGAAAVVGQAVGRSVGAPTSSTTLASVHP